MECEKRLLLQRTAVIEAEILRSEPWQAHLAQCSVCRDAWYNLELSLAVYQQLEREGTESHDTGKEALQVVAERQKECASMATEMRDRQKLPQ